ncbi:unnamed protein product [Ixodes pacificus]
MGPLSYRYRVYELRLHFGRTDDRGSEHSVSGFVFPAELQILGYNCDLYANVSEARQRAQGLVAVAAIIKLRDSANLELRLLTSQLLHLGFKGSQVPVKSVSIQDLVPATDSYMTYEGSATTPGCEETVTWILMNRPLYMTRQQLFATRKLMQGDSFHPKAPLGNNFRPTQPLHGRVVRTNIDMRNEDCPGMQTNKFYQGKPPSAQNVTPPRSCAASGQHGSSDAVAEEIRYRTTSRITSRITSPPQDHTAPPEARPATPRSVMKCVSGTNTEP